MFARRQRRRVSEGTSDVEAKSRGAVVMPSGYRSIEMRVGLAGAGSGVVLRAVLEAVLGEGL